MTNYDKFLEAGGDCDGNNSEIIIYQTPDGKIRIDCRLEGDTLWLTQAQIAELFGRDISGISRHIKNIFTEAKLDPKSNLQNLQIANSDKPVTFYSLDVFLAVGYLIKSPVKCIDMIGLKHCSKCRRS